MAEPGQGAGVQRHVTVTLSDPKAGCKWQHSSDAHVRVIECGNEYDTQTIVFDRDGTATYRVTVARGPLPTAQAAVQPAPRTTDSRDIK